MNIYHSRIACGGYVAIVGMRGHAGMHLSKCAEKHRPLAFQGGEIGLFFSSVRVFLSIRTSSSWRKGSAMRPSSLKACPW